MLVYGSYIQVPNLGVTLFDSYSYDGVSAGIWVTHTGPKYGGELVTFFDSYSCGGVSAGIWVIHTVGCLVIQIRLHMNLYKVDQFCSMNICGMVSFGGLLSE